MKSTRKNHALIDAKFEKYNEAFLIFLRNLFLEFYQESYQSTIYFDNGSSWYKYQNIFSFKLRVCIIWHHFLLWFFVWSWQYFPQSKAMKKSPSMFYFIWKVLFWSSTHSNIFFDFGHAELMADLKASKEMLASQFRWNIRFSLNELWKGRLRYARQFFPILDLMTLILTTIVFSAGQTEQDSNGRRVLATSVLRALRFLQVIRMMRVDRRGSSWKLLGGVLSTHSKELATAIYLGLLTLVFLRRWFSKTTLHNLYHMGHMIWPNLTLNLTLI